MKLTNKTYDTLKWIAQLLLPALGTLYFALSSIWGLPYGEQVIGTITAVDVFLGAILGLSSASYQGDGVLDTTGEYRIKLYEPIDTVANDKKVTLKVIK